MSLPTFSVVVSMSSVSTLSSTTYVTVWRVCAKADAQDAPTDADSYLHRVGRAGRFGTKGLAISFVSSDPDQEVLDKIQERFTVAIPTLPDEVDPSTYMTS